MDNNIQKTSPRSMKSCGKKSCACREISQHHRITSQMLGLAMEAAVVLSIGHRAWGSFVIAGVRVAIQ